MSAWFDVDGALTPTRADADVIRDLLNRMSSGIDFIRFEVDSVDGIMPHVSMLIDGEQEPATWNADGSDSAYAVLDAASVKDRPEWIQSIAFRAGCACYAKAWQRQSFRKLIADNKVSRFPAKEFSA